LKELCTGVNTAWESLGKVNYGRKSSEQSSVKFRRSLYFIKDIKKGEVITTEHVRSIRPGYGLEPKYIDKIIGLVAIKNISKGYPVNLSFIKDV